MTKWSMVLALLLVVPTVVAEQVDTQVVEDDSGDVHLTSADGSIDQQDATGFYKNVDLTALGIWAEDDESVTFYVQVEDLTEASQVPLPLSDPDYYLYFRHGEQGYRVFVATALDNPFNGVVGRSGDLRATLDRQVDEFRFQSIAQATAEMDFSANRLLVSVPRGALVDHNQAPLARGAALEDLYAEARSLGWFGFPIATGGSTTTYVGMPQALDRAPDTGVGAYEMATGTVLQRGDIFAVSQDPVRWTNGEATTLRFQTRITNLGTQSVSIGADVQGADGGWDLAFSNRLDVPAGQSVNHSVLVSIPFNHQHGITKLFQVHYASDDGSHEATSVLGVHWPLVPQPAGHHNTIWFHSLQDEVPEPFSAAFESTHGWLSAKEDLDGDEQVPVLPDFTLMPGFFGAQEGRAIWLLRLEPALRMGLDLRPGEQGEMELSFDLPVTAVDPRVEVRLLHSRPVGEGRNQGTQDTVLMEGASDPITGAVNGDMDLELALHMADGIDDVPYHPEANMVLFIDMRATFLFGPTGVNQASVLPTLDPEPSFMRLPLNEYHDPTDLTFQTDESVRIHVGDAGQERMVNPGNTVVYAFELQFDGTNATTFEASLSGNNAAWASIIGDPVFDLNPDSGRTLALAVKAPEDALDGAQADITLTVQHVGNAALQAGVRTLTTVTSSTEIPDESDYEKELAGELTTEEDAPALPLTILLIGLLLLARRT